MNTYISEMSARRRGVRVSANAVSTEFLDNKTRKLKEEKRREQSRLRKLHEFYLHTSNLEQLLPVLLKKSRVSLRILDWFTTKYAPEYKVTYRIFHPHRPTKTFCVHDSYKAQLKGYHKRYFDPFCRGSRIYFEYYEGCEIETTVGQLSFFKWAIENKVLDYVETHLDRIVAHMKCHIEEKEGNEESITKVTNENTDGKRKASTTNLKISGEIERKSDSTIVAKLDFKEN
tara:strand:- start:3226 stop:3915 length:690 start_codon:yes stop_codon:yes gene_type:complete